MSNENTDRTEALEELTSAVRAIAHGGTSGPGGLEALALAVAGEGIRDSLVGALREGLSEIAAAITEAFDALAAAVRDGREES